MKLLVAWIMLIVTCAAAPRLQGQIAADSPKAAVTSPGKKAKKGATERAQAEKKPKKAEKPSSPGNLLGQAAGVQSNEPITTQIYADEAFFDSTKNMGIFSGRV